MSILMRVSLFIALVATSPAYANGDTLLQRISARLLVEQTLDRHFVQEKQLRVLKRPIRTEGTLLYRGARGVCWATQLPIESLLVLNEKHLRQVTDRTQMEVTAAQQPALFGFTNLFFAALSGRVETLAEHFTIEAKGSDTAWQLSLQPRESFLKKFVTQMELYGGDRIDRVLVNGRTGDVTQIEFSAPTISVTTLETKCFGQ